MSNDPKVQKLIDKAVKDERARITAGIKAAGEKVAADEGFCANGKKGGKAAIKLALATVKAPATAAA